MRQTERHNTESTMQKPAAPALPSLRRPAFAKLSAAVLMSCVMATHAAETPSAPPATPAAAAEAAFTPGQRYSLKQLGAQYPLNLRGVDGSNTLNFSVRNDRVVTGARLDLRYAYSPALLSDISHINVLINDEVAATIPVPHDTAGTNLQRTIDLPPYLITAYNDLRLQLIGHYTLNCEDPLHSSLWANISNNSTLDLATTPLQLPNELSNLPLPFFDQRDMRKLQLPFVFQAKPDEATLEAAGVLSSWFGALASYRGASFPASVGQIPAQGNAIVLAAGPTQSNLAQAAPTGPTLSVVANPNDPNGKLLLVMGRDSKDLKLAAAALVLGSQSLAGQTATITQFADIKPRVPYDAPKWLPADRPVAFGELLDPKRMNVSGFSPDIIRMDVRVPPDLFGWNEKKVPVDLHYRYTPQPTSVNSSLLFSVNDQFVKSLPLFALERIEGGEKLRAQVLPDESLPMHARLDVPLELLKSRGQLQFRYMYDYIKQGECRDIIVDNVRGAIEPDSTIDISGYPHFIAMPDLRAFSQAGFPFTRLADLSETAVVLGDNAGPQEYSAYLTVMGRMGESTGYPALGVTVAHGQQLPAQAGKDLLIIASGADQGLLKTWGPRIPAAYDATARFSVSDLVYRVMGWFHPDPRAGNEAPRTTLAYNSAGVSAFVAGFESPLASKRSVVLVASDKPEGLGDAVAALQGGDGYDKPIQGSLSIIRGKQVDAVVGDHSYYVGELDFFTRIDWWISSWLPGYTLVGLLISLAVALVIIGAALKVLRAVFRRRPPAA